MGRGAWRQNLGLKVLAVVLSVSLWLYVHGTQEVEREIDLPLRCDGLPDSLMLRSDAPRFARVVVGGQAQELLFRRFVPNAELRVDLSRARPPHARIVPGPGDVRLDARGHLRVLRVVEPAPFELAIDRRVTRQLPVRVVLEADLPADWTLRRAPRADPATVRCTGPGSVLARLRDVPTEPVTLGRRSGPSSGRALLAPGHDGIRCDPASVVVVAELAVRGRRSLTGVPVTIEHLPSGNWVGEARPARVTLTVSGPEPDLKSLTAADVALVADAAELDAGTTRNVRLAPRVPSWAQIEEIRPRVVTLVLRKRGAGRD